MYDYAKNKAYQAAYRAAHREKRLEYGRQYAREHRQKLNAQQTERRANWLPGKYRDRIDDDIKVGDFVMCYPSWVLSELGTDTTIDAFKRRPKKGKVIYIHPCRRFLVAEFPCLFGYVREAFWGEDIK